MLLAGSEGITAYSAHSDAARVALRHPVFWAGAAHGFQIPAMLVAQRALRWDAQQDSEINRRIERVLRLTVPCAAAATLLLALLHLGAVRSSALAASFALFAAGQALLIVRRRVTRPANAFSLLRAEIMYLVLGLGSLVALNVRAIETTALGAGICWLGSLLFLCRGWLQWTYYRNAWPRTPLLAAGHRALCVLFPLQALIYLGTAMRIL